MHVPDRTKQANVEVLTTNQVLLFTLHNEQLLISKLMTWFYYPLTLGYYTQSSNVGLFHVKCISYIKHLQSLFFNLFIMIIYNILDSCNARIHIR